VHAVWYDRQGPARAVLEHGELPDPQPGPGEVRVRVRLSGVNPGDTKKRAGWLGSSMPYPRVVPHSDAAGVVDAVGDGVDPARVGRRVWLYGAQSYRPYGTAAQQTVVPADLAVDLPDGVPDELGASLGIPGITAHRAVFADGSVRGTTVPSPAAWLGRQAPAGGRRGIVATTSAQAALLATIRSWSTSPRRRGSWAR
jgi:NADPH2:quinone reductase